MDSFHMLREQKILSIIVPLYKGREYIPSVISMIERAVGEAGIPLPEAELIFVNDYPQDYFGDGDFRSALAVRFLNNQVNLGIHGAKVEGFRKSRGQYILFLDQDDTLHEGYIKYQMRGIHGCDGAVCNGFHRQGERIFPAGATLGGRLSLNHYMENGYPLVSLGQLIMKRESIPQGWLAHILANNGWDDHFFWICMSYEKRVLSYNAECLYTHEEHGGNASLNWPAMQRSAVEFREAVLGMRILGRGQEAVFSDAVDYRIKRYDGYMILDGLFAKNNRQSINGFLIAKSLGRIAVYGIGIFGRHFCQMLDREVVTICYGIDQNAEEKHEAFPVFKEVQEDVQIDAIICTTGYDDEIIKKGLPGTAYTLLEVLLGAGYGIP